MRKHGNMLPISICGIICGLSNCGKTNMLISLLESPHTLRERVHVLEIMQQPKYRYLKNLLALIEEMVILHSLIIAMSCFTEQSASKFYFYL